MVKLIQTAFGLNFSRNIIEQIAQPENFVGFQRGIVADVEAEEVDVIRLRTLFPGLSAQALPEIRLSELIAASGRAAAELNAVLAKSCHHSFAEVRVRLLEDQREGIIATSLGVEVRAVEIGIEVPQEEHEVGRSTMIILIQSTQL